MPDASLDQFELELRRIADGFFDRPSMPAYPLKALQQGILPLESFRRWYTEERHWERSYLFFNQCLLPTLLQKCPDEEGRALLWGLVEFEFGAGQLERAHLNCMRRFYISIGVPEDQLPLSLNLSDTLLRDEYDRLQAADFLELLAGRFLAAELIGPKVFALYVKALKLHYRLTDEDVEFFTIHGNQDVDDADVLFKMVSRYAKTEDQREMVRGSLQKYFDRDRAKSYCALKPISFFWASDSSLSSKSSPEKNA